MHRNLFVFAALFVMLSAALEAGAVAGCTAANPNANLTEATPDSAFTDFFSDGTVIDNTTSLMWKRCAEGQTWDGSTCTGAATAMTWSAALSAAKDSSFSGYSDWRLPNKKELESIVESCGYSPAINQTQFPATPLSAFWSGSSVVPDPSSAWFVDFDSGFTVVGNKVGSYYVRLVRNGVYPFDAQSMDFTPDAFSFTAQTGVALSTVTTSNTITVSGINTGSKISITGGTYKINSGSYTSSAGIVNNGDTVTVQQTSSASYNTTTSAILTIGTTSVISSVSDRKHIAGVSDRKHILALAGVSAAFDVTTMAEPAGACGSANGVATAFAPSDNLCSSGTASAVTSGASWTWTCNGAGTNASCSAPYQSVPTSGGTGHATTSGGTWAVDPAQSAGFIPTTGHAKSPPGLPPGYTFPYGLFDFTLITGAAGSTATITITYPVAPPAGAVYWKYGPSPAGYNCTGAGCAVAHWYQMPPAQAVFAGNSVTLTITDGGVGDDDLTANSIIVDQGGPGVPAVAGIPTLSEWGLILLSGLLALFGAGVVRRRVAVSAPGR